MKSLMFVVPVHGRLRLASICLRQLRHTCDSLAKHGIKASAIVVADADNLNALPDLGFGWVERNNDFLSRKFNDGIQLACDRRHNRQPADYVVTLGSDDWIDWRLLTDLPRHDTIVGFQNVAIVREDGRELATRFIDHDGGSGIRIYPRHVLREVDFRPADEDRRRGCDTSILTNLKREVRWVKVENRDSDPRQIVDWKSAGEQLNSYRDLMVHRGRPLGSPYRHLASMYPKDSLAEIRDHYKAAA